MTPAARRGGDRRGSSPDLPIDRYITNAVDLRNCVAYSEHDEHFVREEHGRIRYLFDSNVAIFYLNPFSFNEYRHVAPFSRRNSSDLQALAAITAEAVFSFRLPGQGNLRPMISRWHAQEFEVHAKQIRDSVAGAAGETDRVAERVGEDRALEELAHSLAEQRHNIQALSRQIGRIESPLEGVGDLMDSPYFEALQFGQMMRNRLIRPLHSDTIAMRGQHGPRPGDAEAQDRHGRDIEAFTRLKGSHAGHDPDDEEAIERDRKDARTFLEIEQLNAAAERLLAGEPTRYVLVTTDHALFNAALDWTVQRGRPATSVAVRRIMQYVPYLDTSDLGRSARGNALRSRIRQTLDSFLTLAGAAPSTFPRTIPLKGSRSASTEMKPFKVRLAKAKDFPFYHAITGDLGHLWAERLPREATFLHAKLLSKRVEPLVVLSSAIDQTNGVRTALYSVMAETLTDVERFHLKLGIEHFLAAAISADPPNRAGNTEGAAETRRGVVVLWEPFAEFVGDEAPLTFMHDLVAGRSTPEARSQLLGRLDDSSSYRGFLFCAAVAFYASNWETAVLFAQRSWDGFRAKRRNTMDPEGLEIRYFSLVARRFEAMNADVVADTRYRRLTALREETRAFMNEMAGQDNRRQIMRAKLETALASLTVAFAAVIDGSGAPLDEGDAAANEAWMLISEAIELQTQILRAKPDETCSPAQQEGDLHLQCELAIAVAGSVIYREFLSRHDADEMRTRLRRWPDRLRRALADAKVRAPKVYDLGIHLMELALSPQRSVQQRTTVRQAIAAELQSAGEMMAGKTRLDHEVLALLSHHMAADTATPG